VLKCGRGADALVAGAVDGALVIEGLLVEGVLVDGLVETAGTWVVAVAVCGTLSLTADDVPLRARPLRR
jgi:hypothetical protein